MKASLVTASGQAAAAFYQSYAWIAINAFTEYQETNAPNKLGTTSGDSRVDLHCLSNSG